MGVCQNLERSPPGSGQIAPALEVVGQALRRVELPGPEGLHELPLIDQAVLEREQAEEQMAVGGSDHGDTPGNGVVTGNPRPREPRPFLAGASERQIIALT